MSKVRQKNAIRRNLILRALLDNGQMSLSEIASTTGVTIPVVSKIVESIKRKKLIIEVEDTKSKGAGRPPSLVKLNGDAGFILGIDFDRIYTKFILLDLEQNIIFDLDKKKCFLSNDPAILDEIDNEIQALLDEYNIKRESLLGIGFSVPGIVNGPAGKSQTYFNFGKENLIETIQKRLKKPVHIEHDVKSMALGELWYGSAKNKKNALCLKIDWGLGLGIIIDGKIYYGNDSFSGEFGHVPVQNGKTADLCYCGKRGCLETVSSGRAIIKIAKEKLTGGELSLLNEKLKGDFETLDSRLIIKAANEGDQFSIEILENAAKQLGYGIAILINIFNPESIILGGNIAATAPSIFIDTIVSYARKYSHNQLNHNLEIIPSKLGFRAGAMGVAMLTIRELFEVDHLNPSAYV